jgi:hypothetical protein
MKGILSDCTIGLCVYDDCTTQVQKISVTIFSTGSNFSPATYTHAQHDCRYTGLVDLFTMTPGALDVVAGARQCPSRGGPGLPPPQIGIALKGNAPMALYNLGATVLVEVSVDRICEGGMRGL